MRVLLTCILVFLELIPRTVFSQEDWVEGAFNKNTGEQLSFDQWMAILPEELDLFSETEPMEITIESDFRKFIHEKYKDNKQKALLHYPLSDSIVVKRVIRIQPRGEFRRKYCRPPPVKLNFKKTEIYVSSIQELDKMKMVSECRRTTRYEEYVLKEYLVYQLYNLISDLSFRSRLLNVSFIETGWKKQKCHSTYAFVIEEVDDIEKRHDLIEVEVKTAIQKDIIDGEMAKVAMFQYMIGNTDWSIIGTHNVKLFKTKNAVQTKAFVVPYDFDYSGLVNAHYAIPSNNFKLENVRKRLFRCECYTDEVFQKTIKLYLEKKQVVLQTIELFPYLNNSAKKDLIRYINEFYRELGSSHAITYFKRNCGKFL